MAATYWQKQTDQPLFPDLLWSRPENRQQAGKLAIIGGNLHGFAAAASAYQASVQAGIGTAKVILPDALQKTVGKLLENGEFAPSTPSGSFSQKALASWTERAQWADAVLIAGDLGRNSETAIALEHFLEKTDRPVTITKDAIDCFLDTGRLLIDRPNTTIVASLAQLQRLSKGLVTEPLKFSMGLVQLVDWLHQFSRAHPAQFVVYHHRSILTALDGQVISTKAGERQSWRVGCATYVSVWWLQNQNQPLKGLASGVWAYTQAD